MPQLPSSRPPVIQLTGLQTETRNPRSAKIDQVTTQELCRILNREDSRIPEAVERCIPVIASAIDVLAERVRSGGRVFYIGAGTSGRLGVLDASEIPPTYSAPAGQFVALIAGGDSALRQAKEGAEDSLSAAEADLAACDLNPEFDSLIGIASSGRTPYVLGGLSFAKSLGCTTVGLVCVKPSTVGYEGNADFLIEAVTGPEVVTGSTRMKAGTATKLVLNMISTGIMIRLGKTYGNLMVDVKTSNLKLQQRARNILRLIAGPTCQQPDEILDQMLDACHGSVKLAAVTLVLNVPVLEAEERLRRNKGVLENVFQEMREKVSQSNGIDDSLVVCVDAGGTSCKAVIMSKSGCIGHGEAGPCNVSSMGITLAIESIAKAIEEAANAFETTKGLQIQSLNFSSAWIGISGYDRPSLSPLVDGALSELFRLPIGKQLRVTTDIDLLPAGIERQQELDSAIVLVAGTGSVAMSYTRSDGEFRRTGRVGGWGHLLGDDGSGFGIGREALRVALRTSDSYRMHRTTGAKIDDFQSPLSRAVHQHFMEPSPSSEPGDILSSVLVPDANPHQSQNATLGPTRRIASLAKVVLDMAMGDEKEAKQIVETGAASLAQLVCLLVNAQELSPPTTVLILAGGLLQHEGYRALVLEGVKKQMAEFGQIEIVDQPAVGAAKLLLERQNIEMNT